MEPYRPRVHTITIPLPFRLKAVNLYLLEDYTGHILIDAGVHTREALDALEGEIDALGVSWKSIHTLFITHYHSDHCGLAAAIRERSGAAIYMATQDFDLLEAFQQRPEMVAGPEEFYVEHGMPRKMVRRLEAATASLMDLIIPFRPNHFYHHGEEIVREPHSFLPIHTPGHTVGHTCIFEQRSGLLFSGDHVLDTITSNIAAHPANPLPDPLRSYLGSLEKLVSLKVSNTLPAHGRAIEDLPRRIYSILAHHEERKQRVLDALESGPASAYTVSSIIFGSDLDLMDQWLAFFETLAHLVNLEHVHRVARASEESRTSFFLPSGWTAGQYSTTRPRGT